MIKTYRKTATIQAEQFDGSQKMIRKYAHPVPKNVPEPSSNSWVTKNGLFEFHIGDWILTKPNGKFNVVPDNEFRWQYDALPVIPKYVAAYLKVSKNSKVTLFCAIYEAPERVTNHPEATLEYISDHSEAFARAWLDGYQVEDGK